MIDRYILFVFFSFTEKKNKASEFTLLDLDPFVFCL